MNDLKRFRAVPQFGLAVAAALLTTLTGCVGYVDQPSAGGPYVETTVVQDDYVYYPNYECYYSVSRHQYAYREGNGWVSRPAPRGVSVNVLVASPSVRMNFHDSPANHHEAVARQYPKNWKPSGSDHGQGEKQKDDGRGGNSGR